MRERSTRNEKTETFLGIGESKERREALEPAYNLQHSSGSTHSSNAVSIQALPIVSPECPRIDHLRHCGVRLLLLHATE